MTDRNHIRNEAAPMTTEQSAILAAVEKYRAKLLAQECEPEEPANLWMDLQIALWKNAETT